MKNTFCISGLLIAFAAVPAHSQSVRNWEFIAIGGVFVPQDDAIDDTYGQGPQGNVALGIPVGGRARMLVGLSYFREKGNPFLDGTSRVFNGNDTATLTFSNLSLALETHALTGGWPRIYLGAGIDYVFAKDALIGLADGTGRSVGAHFSVKPQIKLADKLALVTAVQYQLLEINFKSANQRYKFDLSGTSLMAGLSYTFGRW